jgi:hypothetical protein
MARWKSANVGGCEGPVLQLARAESMSSEPKNPQRAHLDAAGTRAIGICFSASLIAGRIVATVLAAVEWRFSAVSSVPKVKVES